MTVFIQQIIGLILIPNNTSVRNVQHQRQILMNHKNKIFIKKIKFIRSRNQTKLFNQSLKYLMI